MDHVRPAPFSASLLLQKTALFFLIACAASMVAFTACSALGVCAWLEIPLQYRGEPVVQAGMLVQIGVTALLVAMCFFVPTNQRVMQLEAAHHSFSMRMEDIARAYAIAHQDDRKRLFNCLSEFDAVKERIDHLHCHPDLGALEPDILEIAAKMSRVSQDLAEAYSDEKVERAYDFLRQRQTEIATFQERLDHARALHSDIKQWANRLEMDEAVANSQLHRLLEDLEQVLPEIAKSDNAVTSGNRVVRMQTPKKK